MAGGLGDMFAIQKKQDYFLEKYIFTKYVTLAEGTFLSSDGTYKCDFTNKELVVGEKHYEIKKITKEGICIVLKEEKHFLPLGCAGDFLMLYIGEKELDEKGLSCVMLYPEEKLIERT
ncbi:MAG: hypothetical protein K6G65_06020 [Lachnospiraceae bacterium]|nr:hypothetical protein [Lachnospiraceae bacterium]